MINIRIPRNKPTPLDGLYVHTLRNGRIHEQGIVESTRGTIAYVMLFSWLDGMPTHKVAFTKRYLRSNKCQLYTTQEQMRDAYQRDCDRHRAEDEAEAKAIVDRAIQRANVGGNHGRP